MELELVSFLPISGNKSCHGNTLFNSLTYNCVGALDSELLRGLELIVRLAISDIATLFYLLPSKDRDQEIIKCLLYVRVPIPLFLHKPHI